MQVRTTLQAYLKTKDCSTQNVLVPRLRNLFFPLQQPGVHPESPNRPSLSSRCVSTCLSGHLSLNVWQACLSPDVPISVNDIVIPRLVHARKGALHLKLSFSLLPHPVNHQVGLTSKISLQSVLVGPSSPWHQMAWVTTSSYVGLSQGHLGMHSPPYSSQKADLVIIGPPLKIQPYCPQIQSKCFLRWAV